MNPHKNLNQFYETNPIPAGNFRHKKNKNLPSSTQFCGRVQILSARFDSRWCISQNKEVPSHLLMGAGCDLSLSGLHISLHLCSSTHPWDSLLYPLLQRGTFKNSKHIIDNFWPPLRVPQQGEKTMLGLPLNYLGMLGTNLIKGEKSKNKIEMLIIVLFCTLTFLYFQISQ